MLTAIEEILELGIRRGGTVLLRAVDAIKLVEALECSNIPILGIDGFIITDIATQPLMEHSIDFFKSSFSEDGNVWRASRAFLNRADRQHLCFEVVFDTDQAVPSSY